MQTPRSILLHLDRSARTVERIKLARQLAETFDAEVTGQYCTPATLLHYPFAMDGAAEAMAAMQESDRAARDRIHATFVATSAGSQRMHWAEPTGDVASSFGRRAFYADLILLGQRDRSDPLSDELPGDFQASLLVESGRPALVLPYVGPLSGIGRHVLVAWKETREAAHAVSAALPWLRTADRVHVLCYGKEAASSLRSLQEYLKVQGVAEVTLHPGGPGVGDVGDRLLSHAADLDADLLVMGCYGHSRAREWVLGGATLSILQSMTLPVLMSH